MNRLFITITAIVLCATTAFASGDDDVARGVTTALKLAGETYAATSVQDTNAVRLPEQELPLWKQKLYYGYNFDIYFHHDTRSGKKENGWSISLTPEIGWRLKERTYLGVRLGGTFEDTYATYDLGLTGLSYTQNMRIMRGSWEVTPYVRYRLKTLFDDKVGIWLEAHLYAGMDFPRVKDGTVAGTDYDGLRHSVTYGAQVSPVITYQFSKSSTFQIFFSIMSFGYSGSTLFYEDPQDGRYCEFSNDIIIFSGKLRNMLSNQFTPGLYGLKFGVQKSF